MLDTLAEIQERHEAVKELERSLLDLHQIFLDMAVLVEAQGEMLDNIEAQVSLYPLTISYSPDHQLGWVFSCSLWRDLGVVRVGGGVAFLSVFCSLRRVIRREDKP